ncbi:hypothetical protein V1599_05195 [Enterobacter sp. ECC-175]|uniref:hypothetical protein n=1 Tax=Enterobacter sp. ECC-175 TaxID=3116479 RepID=UPI0037544754
MRFARDTALPAPVFARHPATFFIVPLAHYFNHNDRLSYNKALDYVLVCSGIWWVNRANG